jgi:hypothetical protein
METIVRSTKVYGTTGLPYFGSKAIEGDKSANVAKVDALFNDFLLGMKNIAATSPGGNIALGTFATWLQSGYGYGIAVAAGKDVVANV